VAEALLLLIRPVAYWCSNPATRTAVASAWPSSAGHVVCVSHCTTATPLRKGCKGRLLFLPLNSPCPCAYMPLGRHAMPLEGMPLGRHAGLWRLPRGCRAEDLPMGAPHPSPLLRRRTRGTATASRSPTSRPR